MWLCHYGFFPAHGELLYQLTIFAENEPAGALDKINRKTLFLIETWLDLIPGYTVVGPGQTEMCHRRLGEDNSNGTSPVLRGGGKGSSSSAAASRDLGVLSLCPANCKTAATKKCKNLSCCGLCERRRQRGLQWYDPDDVTCSQIKAVEWIINSQLVQYCNWQRNCSIKGKVMELSLEGNHTVSTPACP